MLARQHVECPRCGREEVVDYNADDVVIPPALAKDVFLRW